MEVRDHDSFRFHAHSTGSEGPATDGFSKLRCPSCQKLYSVDPRTLRTAQTALRFECTDCKCQFEAKHAHSPLSTIIETFEISVPATSHLPASQAPLVTIPPLAGRSCPKCGTAIEFKATDCRSCGVIFAKYRPTAQTLEDGTVGEVRTEKREILELWESVRSDYGDRARHDAFITTCFDANLLTFASRQYSQILSASPNEEIAREMRRKIIALASFQMEPRGRHRAPQFRVPKFNNLILVLGGAVLTMGEMLPNAKNLSRIGIAAIVLALGVRYFLARRE